MHKTTGQALDSVVLRKIPERTLFEKCLEFAGPVMFLRLAKQDQHS